MHLNYKYILIFILYFSTTFCRADEQPVIDLMQEKSIEYSIINKNPSNNQERGWNKYSEFDFDLLTKGDTLLLRAVLTNAESSDQAIYLNAYLPGFNVIIDSNIIYSYFPENKPYYNQHIISINEDINDSVIYFQIPVIKRSNIGYIYSLMLGEWQNLNQIQLIESKTSAKNSFFYISIVAILLFTSFLSLVLFFYRLKQSEYQYLFYFLTTLATIFENIDMRIFVSLSSIPVNIVSDIEAFARYSLIIFLLLFIKYAFRLSGKIIKMILYFFLVYSSTALILYFFNFSQILYTFLGQVYAIFIFIALIINSVIIIKSGAYKKLRNKKLILFFIAIFFLIVCYITFITVFYFEYHREAPLLLAVLFIAFAMMTLLIGDYLDSTERNIKYKLELEVQQNEILKLQQANIESQYEALKSQINPHFLFNSLNALSSLVYPTPQPLKARQFIDEFSKIYRYVLDVHSKNVVTLKEELQFVKSYFFLQKIRFSEGLELIDDTEDEKLELVLPPLSLQIIIENAIKHNIISKEKPLTIQIKNEGNMLIVKNNLQPRNKKSESRTGLGQKNIMERYTILTEDKPVFSMAENYYIAVIPLLQDEQD